MYYKHQILQTTYTTDKQTIQTSDTTNKTTDNPDNRQYKQQTLQTTDNPDTIISSLTSLLCTPVDRSLQWRCPPVASQGGCSGPGLVLVPQAFPVKRKAGRLNTELFRLIWWVFQRYCYSQNNLLINKTLRK